MRKVLSVLILAMIVGALGTAATAEETVKVSGSTTVLPLAEGGARHSIPLRTIIR